MYVYVCLSDRLSDQIFNIKDHKSQNTTRSNKKVRGIKQREIGSNINIIEINTKKNTQNENKSKNLTNVCSIDLDLCLFFLLKWKQQQQKEWRKKTVNRKNNVKNQQKLPLK